MMLNSQLLVGSFTRVPCAVEIYVEEIATVVSRISGGTINVQLIDAETIAAINGIGSRSPRTVVAYRDHVIDILVLKYGHCRAIIVTDLNHPFAELTKKALPLAEWGSAWVGMFGLVYQSPITKPVVWHETLHVLGAEDCYDQSFPAKSPTCEHPNCIMQYEPNDRCLKNGLSLCEKNRDLLRPRAQKQ